MPTALYHRAPKSKRSVIMILNPPPLGNISVSG